MGVSWSLCSGKLLPDPSLCFSLRHGGIRGGGYAATHHHLTAQGLGPCGAGELWG